MRVNEANKDGLRGTLLFILVIFLAVFAMGGGIALSVFLLELACQ